MICNCAKEFQFEISARSFLVDDKEDNYPCFVKGNLIRKLALNGLLHV